MQPLAKVCKDQLGAYLDEHQLSAVSARRRDTRVVFAQVLAPIVAAADERRLVRVTRDGNANLLTRVKQALARQGYALIVYSMDQMRDFIAFPAFEHTMNRIKEQLGEVVTILEPGFYGRFHMFCVVRPNFRADLLALAQTLCADSNQSETQNNSATGVRPNSVSSD